MLNSIFSRIMNVGAVQRQSITSLFWQVVYTLIGFASTVYFAHAVGATILGAYFLFVAYNGIFSMVTDGGFGGAAIKRISEGEEQNAFFSAFFALRSIFVIAVVISLIIFRGYFSNLNDAGLFGLLLVILIVSGFTGTVGIGTSGRGKMGIRATCNTISTISSIIFQIIAIFLGFGAAGLAGGLVAGVLVGNIIEFHFFDLHFAQFRWQHIKSLFVFAFWSFLTSTGVLVFLQADTILIGYFMKNADVGVYRVVLQLTTIATFTTYALRNTLWPKVSQWGKSGEMGLVEESLARSFSYSLILAVPVMVGGLLLGDRLLYFFYGAEFAKGSTVLMILLAVQVMNVFQYFFTMYLDALNHPKESFKVTALAATANIALDIALIPVFGIIGAAIATLLSVILNVFLARHALSRLMTIRVERGSLMNILKASMVMGVLVGGYRLLIPLSNVWLVLLPVFLGGLVFSVLILKLDKKIYEDLKKIMTQINLPWPYWI